jgi:hypothetical protein
LQSILGVAEEELEEEDINLMIICKGRRRRLFFSIADLNPVTLFPEPLILLTKSPAILWSFGFTLVPLFLVITSPKIFCHH